MEDCRFQMVLSTLESLEMVNSMEMVYCLLQKEISFMESTSKIKRMAGVFNLEVTKLIWLEMFIKAISLMALEKD